MQSLRSAVDLNPERHGPFIDSGTLLIPNQSGEHPILAVQKLGVAKVDKEITGGGLDIIQRKKVDSTLVANSPLTIVCVEKVAGHF